MKNSNTKASARAQLFGMSFDVLSFAEAVERLVRLARGSHAAYAVTANVDHVLRYDSSPGLRAIYDEADLLVADGMPLIWASKALGRPLPERVAGSDLFPALCERAAASGLRVFFLGGAPGAAQACAEVLCQRHPALVVAGTYCPDFGFERDSLQCEQIVDAVRAARADILFVGLGSPKQEQWICRYREACKVPLSIGIGISFGFVSGQVRRAPLWMQRGGLEWAHRLLQEPGRLWRRYLVEDPAFAALVLREWHAQRRTNSFQG